MVCPKCQKPMWGVQYRGTPEDYDGLSEWRCEDGCGYRVGRWTGRALGPDELEPRYGIAKADPR